MSPRLEREQAMDDMADYALAHAARFAPIPCPLPDTRKSVRLVPAQLVATRPNLIDAFGSLPAASLVVEARALQARMLGAEYSSRDFAIVSALVNRLEAA